MSIRSVLFSSLVAFLCAAPTKALPVEQYVNYAVGASGDGSTWESALKTIQEGIDAASHGDTVVVAQGTYFENVKVKGKNITLRSTDPSDPAVVNNTIIPQQRYRLELGTVRRRRVGRLRRSHFP